MPSGEERAQDRILRGFANFDNLKELQDWTKEKVDDLQRANIPLLQRPEEIPEAIEKPESSNIMLMHDYRGNYLHNGYEGCQGAIVDGEEYVLEQWQRVEAFNYFSHCRASIPPPSWVNAGHRNGALVLGTIDLENNDDEPKLMLEKDSATNEYWFAERLFQMAKHYGFDGWLLNLELKELELKELELKESGVWEEGKAYKAAWKDGSPFTEMLTSLKRKLETLPGKGKLIWYDAHTMASPFVEEYANTLNIGNRDIAKAAGSMVTNYGWDLDGKVNPAVTLATESQISLSAVYFGIDTWAQTADSETGNPRYAYGLDEENGTGTSVTGKGHGGTATGLAVKPLAENKLGAGIFAPGWAYEHWKASEGGRAVDRYMWDGLPDLKDAGVHTCKCHNGLDQHIRDDFCKIPIAHYAKQYPVGSESFFYTDFIAASHLLQRPDRYYMNISQQSVLPTPDDFSKTLAVEPVGTAEGRIEIRFENQPSLGSSVGISIKAGQNFSADTQLVGTLPLYHCNARGELKLDLSITYRRPVQNPGIAVHLYVQVGSIFEKLDLPIQPQSTTLSLPLQNTEDRITDIGITAVGRVQDLGPVTIEDSFFNLLDISSISLKPTGQNYPRDVRIQDLQLLQLGDNITLHHRLKWSYPSITIPYDFLMPWSDVTGPFSHFEIRIEQKLLGRAYALQFIIDESLYRAWWQEKKKVHVDITGYAFDGTAIGFLNNQEITLV